MKPLKEISFQYSYEVSRWVNTNDVTVVSIASSGRYSEGFTLFYRENPTLKEIRNQKLDEIEDE